MCRGMPYCLWDLLGATLDDPDLWGFRGSADGVLAADLPASDMINGSATCTPQLSRSALAWLALLGSKALPNLPSRIAMDLGTFEPYRSAVSAPKGDRAACCRPAVAEIEWLVAARTRAAVIGALSRATRTRWPKPCDID